jgi:hypothetical protein
MSQDAKLNRRRAGRCPRNDLIKKPRENLRGARDFESSSQCPWGKFSGLPLSRKSRLDVEADLKAGTLLELLQEFSSGDTGLQIAYPTTQAQAKRVRLPMEKIAEAFSSSGR